MHARALTFAQRGGAAAGVERARADCAGHACRAGALVRCVAGGRLKTSGVPVCSLRAWQVGRERHARARRPAGHRPVRAARRALQRRRAPRGAPAAAAAARAQPLVAASASTGRGGALDSAECGAVLLAAWAGGAVAAAKGRSDAAGQQRGALRTGWCTLAGAVCGMTLCAGRPFSCCAAEADMRPAAAALMAQSSCATTGPACSFATTPSAAAMRHTAILLWQRIEATLHDTPLPTRRRVGQRNACTRGRQRLPRFVAECLSDSETGSHRLTDDSARGLPSYLYAGHALLLQYVCHIQLQRRTDARASAAHAASQPRLAA